MPPHDFAPLLGTARVMVILRDLPPDETLRLARHAWDLGIDAVEVPVRTPEALPALRATVVLDNTVLTVAITVLTTE
ncbi:2-dehydro-3-deoxyphosphogluconate aldolase, partial [Micromonospora sp. NPDC004336]